MPYGQECDFDDYVKVRDADPQAQILIYRAITLLMKIGRIHSR